MLINMNQKMPCVYDFSRGNGTGVAEAIGNWGFSNRVTSSGNELQRVKNIWSQINCLRGNKSTLCVKYDCRNDPETWHVKPSHHECKPAWTFPFKRPLITYSSTTEIMVRSNLTDCLPDLAYPMPGRSYYIQGSNKWYRRGPDCCPQPSFLAPQCQRPCQ